MSFPRSPTYFITPAPLDPHLQHTCWLSAIISRTATHYIYAVSFKPEYPYTYAFVHIPSDLVTERMAQNFDNHRRLHREPLGIDQNNGTMGTAAFGDLLAMDEATNQGIRGLQVEYKEYVFEGEVRVPRQQVDEGLEKAREELSALESVEDEPREWPERRTVVFSKSPQKNQPVRVEVWAVDGQSWIESDATVQGLERKEERRWVTIKAQVPETRQWVRLKGDLEEKNTWHRVARCMEVSHRMDTKSGL